MDFAYHCIRGLSNQKKRAHSLHKGITFSVVEKDGGWAPASSNPTNSAASAGEPGQIITNSPHADSGICCSVLNPFS